MLKTEFCYWLQGFVEIQNPTQPTETQWQIIKDHLSLTIKGQSELPPKMDPSKTPYCGCAHYLSGIC